MLISDCSSYCGSSDLVDVRKINHVSSQRFWWTTCCRDLRQCASANFLLAAKGFVSASGRIARKQIPGPVLAGDLVGQIFADIIDEGAQLGHHLLAAGIIDRKSTRLNSSQ